MRIQSTKKLLDQLPFAPVIETEEEEGNPLYAWHANLLVINRRKTVVLMNDPNQYVVVLHGLKAKGFKNFDALIKKAIRQSFEAERISEEVIEAYMKAAGEVSFHKTKNRSFVARLNQACDHTWLHADGLNPENLVNAQVGKKASRFFVGVSSGKGFCPYEKLFEDLAETTNKAIFSTEVAVLNVSMELMEHSVWRKLLVPLDTTFQEFHQILQIVFDWHDYHLHEFYLYDEEVTDKSQNERMPRPKLNLVMDEEAFDYGSLDIEMKLEEGILLSDFIPPHTYIKYIYDFGDYWCHDIVVEEILHNQDVSAPICIEGEGTAPPEDSGGQPGFDYFMKIIKNPSDPEYDEMESWARMQLYRKFDIDLINMRLDRF